MRVKKQFHTVALTLVGGSIFLFETMFAPTLAWSAEGVVEGIQYNPLRQSFTVSSSGPVRSSFNATTVNGNKRLILDIENAGVGLALPREGELLSRLQSQWSAVQNVSINQFGGARPVVRILIDLVGDSYNARLVEGAGGSLELRVEPVSAARPVAADPPVLRNELRPLTPEPHREPGNVSPLEYQRALNTIEQQKRELDDLRVRLGQVGDKLLQVESLREQVRSLQLQLQDVNSRYEQATQARSRLSDAESRYSALSSEYQQSQRRVQELQAQVSQLAERNQILMSQQGDVSGLKDDYERLKARYRQLMEQQGQSGDLASRLARQETVIRDLKSQLADVETRYQSSQRELGQIRQDASGRPDGQSDELKRRYEELQRRYQELADRYSSSQQLVQDLQARMAELASAQRQAQQQQDPGLQERLSRLHANYSASQQQVRTLQEQLAEVSHRYKQLEQQLAQLRAQASSPSELDGLKQEVTALTRRNQDLQRELAQARSQAAEGERAVQSLRSQQDQSSALAGRYNELNAQYQALQQDSASYRERVQLLERTNADLRSQLERALAEKPPFSFEDMKKALAVLNRKYGELESENRQLRSAHVPPDRLNALKAEVEKARQSLAQSVETINRQNKEIAALTEQLNEVRQGMDAAARQQVAALSQKLEETEARLAQREDALKNLSAENSGLRMSVDTLRKQLADGQEGEEQLTRLKRALAAMNEQLEALHKAKNAMEEALLTARSENSQLKEALAERPTEEKVKSLRDSLTALSTEKSDLQAKLQQASQELQQARATQSDQVRTLQAKVEELQSTLNAAEKEKNTLSAEKSDMEVKLGQTREALQQASQELQQARATQSDQVRTLQAKVNEVQAALNAVETDRKALQDQLDSVRSDLQQARADRQGAISEAQKIQEQMGELSRKYLAKVNEADQLKADLSAARTHGIIPPPPLEQNPKYLALSRDYENAIREKEALQAELKAMQSQASVKPTPVEQSPRYLALQEQTQAQKSRLVEYEKQLGDLQGRIRNLEDVQRQNQVLKSQVAALQAESTYRPPVEQMPEYVALQTQLSSQQEEISRLRDELQTTTRNYKMATAQNEALKQQVAGLQADSTQQAPVEGSPQYVALQRQLEDQQGQLSRLREELRETAENYKVAVARNEALKQQVAGLQADSTQQIPVEESPEYIALQRQLEDQQGQLSRLREELRETAENYKVAVARNEALKQQVAGLQADSTQQTPVEESPEYIALQQQLASQESRLTGYQSQLARLEQQLEEANRNYQAALRENDTLKQRIASLESRPANDTPVTQSPEYIALRQQLDGEQGRLASLQSELAEANRRYQDSRSQIDTLQQQLSQARAQAGGSSGNDAQIARLNEELRQAAAKNASLEEALRRLQQRQPTTSANPRAEEFYIRGKELEDNGKIVEATVLYRDAYKLESDVTRYVTAYADGLLKTGNPAEATRILELFLTNNPYELEGYNLLGKAYLLSGRLEEAQQAFAMAIPVSVLNNYATTLKKLGRMDESERIFLTALSLNPNDSDLLFNLGNLYNATNDLQKARNAYQQALSIRPNFGPAHYNLGLIYSKMGDKSNAIVHLERFLSLSPNASNADVVRKYVEKLKSGV